MSDATFTFRDDEYLKTEFANAAKMTTRRRPVGNQIATAAARRQQRRHSKPHKAA